MKTQGPGRPPRKRGRYLEVWTDPRGVLIESDGSEADGAAGSVPRGPSGGAWTRLDKGKAPPEKRACGDRGRKPEAADLARELAKAIGRDLLAKARRNPGAAAAFLTGAGLVALALDALRQRKERGVYVFEADRPVPDRGR